MKKITLVLAVMIATVAGTVTAKAMQSKLDVPTCASLPDDGTIACPNNGATQCCSFVDSHGVTQYRTKLP